jgi:hypothetical protein
MTLSRRAHRSRWWTALGAALLTVLGVVTGPTGPALAADPRAGWALADPDADESDNGLRKKLEDAAVAYSEASAELKNSQKRQTELEKQIRTADKEYLALTAEVGRVAAGRYKGSQVGLVSALLGARNSSDMLQGATVAAYLIDRDDAKLRQLNDLRVNGQKRRDALNAEIHEQEKHFAALEKAKTKAEAALAAAGGMVSAGFKGDVPAAQPAKRNANGGWSGESCKLTDPTGTGGCITARMSHTLNEARLAGFTHYTKCWRTQSFGEHPKGRACDFAADPDSFGGVASGSSRAYGNRLAAWAVKNAEALGIMYVIWYKQIWELGIGWHSFDGDGTPSGDHYNHVHISMF